MSKNSKIKVNLREKCLATPVSNKSVKISQKNADKLDAAFTLHQQGLLNEAEAIYKEVLQTQPEHFDALQLMATIAVQQGNPALAVEFFDKVLKINPNHAEVLNNLGTALVNLNRTEEALKCYDRALGIKTDFVKAHINRGVALRDLKRIEEALESIENALKIDPNNVVAYWHESMCRLLIGDFALGWRRYESRWNNEPLLRERRNFKQPLWLGKEKLGEKIILLHGEQGFGDTIQFCRYAKQVAGLGGKVILEVQPQLKTLMKSLDGVAMVLGTGDVLPDFDFHCPLMSLGLALVVNLENISGESYLQSDPVKVREWKTNLGSGKKKKIGLVWSGRTTHTNDINRSVPLAEFMAIVNVDADFYCLQKELRPADKFVLEQTPTIRFLGDEIIDFSDTAALIELMDLVITVDTSVAHLAGAMGKPVWIMLPYRPDWRWMLNRNDSPWYNSARLFRQPKIGDWVSTINEVVAALKELVGCGNAPQLTISSPEPL